MKYRMAVILLAVLLLTGCTPLLDREYRVQTLHSGRYQESDNTEILRAESYQDVVNDLLLLVSERREQAMLRLYINNNEVKVSELLEQAVAEVKNDTPMGSYAVGYITTKGSYAHDYYEVTVRIGYRRSQEQMKAVVTATSTAALEDLLDSATESGRSELAVRIGYWDAADEDVVEDAMRSVEAARGLTGIRVWKAAYYPATGEVGLIEFRLESVPQLPEPPVEQEQPAEPQMPAEGETPTDGEVQMPVEGTVNDGAETPEVPTDSVSEIF